MITIAKVANKNCRLIKIILPEGKYRASPHHGRRFGSVARSSVCGRFLLRCLTFLDAVCVCVCVCVCVSASMCGRQTCGRSCLWCAYSPCHHVPPPPNGTLARTLSHPNRCSGRSYSVRACTVVPSSAKVE